MNTAISFYVVTGEPDIRFRHAREKGPLIYHVDTSELETHELTERAPSLHLLCVVPQKQSIKVIPAPQSSPFSAPIGVGGNGLDCTYLLQMDLALSSDVSRVRVLANVAIEYVPQEGIRLVPDTCNGRHRAHSLVTLLDVHGVREKTITTTVPVSLNQLRPARFASSHVHGAHEPTHSSTQDAVDSNNTVNNTDNNNNRVGGGGTSRNNYNGENHTLPAQEETEANATGSAASGVRRDIVFAPIVVIIDQPILRVENATSVHTSVSDDQDAVYPSHNDTQEDAAQTSCVSASTGCHGGVSDRADASCSRTSGEQPSDEASQLSVLYTFLDLVAAAEHTTPAAAAPADGPVHTSSEVISQAAPICTGEATQTAHEQQQQQSRSVAPPTMAFSVTSQLLQYGVKVFQLEDIFDTGANEDQDEAASNVDDNDVCVICLTNKNDTTLLPCKHMCVCHECATQLQMKTNKCPICRTPICHVVTC